MPSLFVVILSLSIDNLLIFIQSAYLHCGYFYLVAIIGILPASDEPPISEPHVPLISRRPIIFLVLASSIGR
nr:MAG TPA: hypothetical protein [Bacteriophage sp.]